MAIHETPHPYQMTRNSSKFQQIQSVALCFLAGAELFFSVGGRGGQESRILVISDK